MITIGAPDGSQVQFPDGTDDGVIKSVMAKNFPKPAASAPPALRPTVDAPDPTAKPAPKAPTPSVASVKPQSSFGLGFDQGFVQPVLNAGVGIEKTLGMFGIPSINKMLGGHSAQEVHDAHALWLQHQQDPNAPDNDAPGQSRTPGLGGEIVGGALSTVPTLLATRNPFILGGMQGALQSQGNAAKEVATDAGVGAVAGKLGDAGVKAIGAITAPIWRPTVNKLLAEGVKLTPGQITGGMLHRLEDATMSFPAIGDMVAGASKRGQASYNIAGVNRALSEIGDKVPDGVEAGHPAIDWAQKRFGHEYDSILPQMRVTDDPPLHADLNGLLQQAQTELPADHFRNLDKIIKENVIAPLNRGTQAGQPQITGETLKDMDSVFNAEMKKFQTGTGFDQKYAAFVSDVKDAVHDAMGRQNPTLKPALDAADKGYSTLATLETAAAPANQGTFTPTGLNTATRMADPSIRKRASAAGRAKLQDLATAGMDVMNRTVPDSGTAYRALVNTGTAAALYGAAPHMVLNPLALGAAATAVSPYTRIGGEIARRAMSSRPAFAPTLRGAIDRLAKPAAISTTQYAVDKRNQAHLRHLEP